MIIPVAGFRDGAKALRLAGMLVNAGLLWVLRSGGLFSLVRRFDGRFRRGRAEL